MWRAFCLSWIRLNWNKSAQIADDLSVGICAQWHKRTHFGEGREIPILIGLQDRHDAASFRVQAGEKFGGHTFPVHDHLCDPTVPCALFIARKERRDSRSH